MDDTKNTKIIKRGGGNRIRRRTSIEDRLDGLLKRAKENGYLPYEFDDAVDAVEEDFYVKVALSSPINLLRLCKGRLEAHERLITTNRAYQRLEKKDPGRSTKWLRWAEKNLDKAEQLLLRIPHGKNFDDPVYRDYFNELCSHSDSLMGFASLTRFVAIGVDMAIHQRKANEARNNSKDGTVTNIIKDLAKRKDFKPSELWYEFCGDLDLHDLEPDPKWDAEKDEEVIHFIGGKMGYGAFRKRIIRYRK